MKHVLFRVNSSSMIGLGHLMRCLTLAKQYSNHKIVFVCENLQGNLNQKVIESGYELESIQDDSVSTLIQVIEKYKPALLVIDNYAIDYSYEKEIKAKTAVKILSFDDLYEKHCCDIVLNHNIYANKKKYEGLVPSLCEKRCGNTYTLIRDEFLHSFKKVRQKRSIFIAIGGTDHLGLNIAILRVLQQVFPKYILNVVTTTANKRLKQLKNFCQRQSNIQLHINSNELAKLMNESCLAVVTPSVVVHEVLHMKLPFIAIQTASNQKFMYEYLKQKHFNVLPYFSTLRFKTMIQRLKHVF